MLNQPFLSSDEPKTLQGSGFAQPSPCVHTPALDVTWKCVLSPPFRGNGAIMLSKSCWARPSLASLHVLMLQKSRPGRFSLQHPGQDHGVGYEHLSAFPTSITRKPQESKTQSERTNLEQKMGRRQKKRRSKQVTKEIKEEERERHWGAVRKQ